MLPSRMKCSNCQLWAYMGDGKGECGQMYQPEQLTEFFVRHFVPDPGGNSRYTSGPCSSGCNMRLR